MGRIVIITEKQKDQLIGRKYDEASYFNPVQDKSGNWLISEEEIAAYKFIDFDFIKTLPQKEYTPPTDVLAEADVKE